MPTPPPLINLSGINKQNFEGVALRLLPLSERDFGATLLHGSLPASSATPATLHKHTWEFVFVLSGRAQAYLAERRFSIKAGDMFSIAPGVPHIFKTGRQGVAALSLFSPPLNTANPDVHPVTTAGVGSRHRSPFKKRRG